MFHVSSREAVWHRPDWIASNMYVYSDKTNTVTQPAYIQLPRQFHVGMTAKTNG